MTARADVLTRVEAVNLGLSTFADALRDQGAPVVEVDWRPPAGGDADAVRAADARCGAATARAIAEANARGGRGDRGRPTARAVTVAPAGDGRAGAGRRDAAALRAADRVGAGVRPAAARAGRGGAVRGLGRRSRGGAAALLARGEITLEPGNAHDHVGPMTGVCSPSMPVWVVEDASGARAYSTLNEGPGRTLWFGVGDDEAVERLRFFRDDLGPRLAADARRTAGRSTSSGSPPRG